MEKEGCEKGKGKISIVSLTDLCVLSLVDCSVPN